ncbi:MAG: hypothetical protein FJ014_09555 [Chloroflexi bacterium]|nr:hypothetical protein [Chloroflexota bacterium]
MGRRGELSRGAGGRRGKGALKLKAQTPKFKESRGAGERGGRGAREQGSRGAEERPDLCSPARHGIIKLATDPDHYNIPEFGLYDVPLSAVLEYVYQTYVHSLFYVANPT